MNRLRRDPGLALVLLAIVAATALYAPTLRRGLIDYDDPWLYGNNYLVQHPSWSSLDAIAFDLGQPTRYSLGAEYLPVRDLSVMADYAVWGRWYPGFHLTNLALYLAAIALWFAALDALGIDRKVAGLAALVWALHPTHAESVAWLAERKGLLGVALSGAATLGYARFRTGRGARYLVLAMVAAVAAVWSKAPAAFAIAALAGLELVAPARRASWRRSLAGLGAIAAVSLAAFVPVLIVALEMSVVGAGHSSDASWLALVLGLHGFYLRLGAMTVANAISYPIVSHGPSIVDIALGAVGLIAVLAVALVPRLGRRVPALRVAAVIWLFGWFPVSRIALPVRKVLVADRYLLIPSVGLALAVAVGVAAVASRRARLALATTIVLAAGLRTLDAQSSWRDALTLWTRAVRSNPDDGDAWSLYADQLDDAGRHADADKAVAIGLSRSRTPRLVLRAALLSIERGKRAAGATLMREAAHKGDATAMTDLAVLLLADHEVDDALRWARRAVVRSPAYPAGYRILGKVELAAGHTTKALAAWRRAYALERTNLDNSLNLGVGLLAMQRGAEARPYLEACLHDPKLAARARKLLGMIDHSGP